VRLRGRTASLPPDYLGASLRAPVSPYEIKAGTIIPAVLLSAVNSDLPEQVLGQVREAVYDTENGQHLLVPQETRLVGPYDHHVVYGQERVPITWKRLILPNGSSLSLKDGMPGTDAVGAAGFHDQVNHHDLRTRGNALLLSVISTGVHLSQTPDFGRNFRARGRERARPHRGSVGGQHGVEVHPPGHRTDPGRSGRGMPLLSPSPRISSSPGRRTTRGSHNRSPRALDVLSRVSAGTHRRPVVGT